MSTIITNYLDINWINGDFKNILVTFNSLNNFNNLDVPVVGSYISSIFTNLKSLSYQFQDQYQCLTYNPLFLDDSLYFCNNNLFHDTDLITLQNMLQLSQSLVDLQNVVDYLVDNNFTGSNGETANIDDYCNRLYNTVKFITRYISDDSSTLFLSDLQTYGYVDTSLTNTSVQIGNEMLNIFCQS